MLKKVALIFGVVFVLIGILGFIPGITTTGPDGMKLLLGMFMVDPMHNGVHLVSGLLALLAAGSERYARLYLQIFGVIYALVAVLGLIGMNPVLWFININMADNLLHVVLAIALLGAGFGLRTTERTAAV